MGFAMTWCGWKLLLLRIEANHARSRENAGPSTAAANAPPSLRMTRSRGAVLAHDLEFQEKY